MNEERVSSFPLPQTSRRYRMPGLGLRRRLLGISPEETSFARRRFRGEGGAAVRERLEKVGRCFVAGYNAALEEDGALPLAARLVATPFQAVP